MAYKKSSDFEWFLYWNVIHSAYAHKYIIVLRQKLLLKIYLTSSQNNVQCYYFFKFYIFFLNLHLLYLKQMIQCTANPLSFVLSTLQIRYILQITSHVYLTFMCFIYILVKKLLFSSKIICQIYQLFVLKHAVCFYIISCRNL